jgi:hypothetical protein
MGAPAERRHEDFQDKDDGHVTDHGIEEADRPLTVREQLERIRRTYSSSEPAGHPKRKLLLALWSALVLLAVVVSQLPKLWSGPAIWGVQRNWTHGSVCYYADFAHKEQCLTTPNASLPRTQAGGF